MMMIGIYAIVKNLLSSIIKWKFVEAWKVVMHTEWNINVFFKKTYKITKESFEK